MFEGKSRHGCGGAEFEFEGWIVTEFDVVEIETLFFPASQDGDYTGGGGF